MCRYSLYFRQRTLCSVYDEHAPYDNPYAPFVPDVQKGPHVWDTLYKIGKTDRSIGIGNFKFLNRTKWDFSHYNNGNTAWDKLLKYGFILKLIYLEAARS